ncbi:hypothetical protein QR66_08455 [Chromobacterium piscinae]|nr:hypothetical protein QR66_08455 [Chromobacterium piscinae]
MATYRIEGEDWPSDHPQLQDVLRKAYERKLRPACLCLPPFPAMYLVQYQGRILAKRMPNTGGHHASACESYEPPAELSGLGQVLGSAIQENVDDGQVLLKFDFSLKKLGAKTAPEPSGVVADSVKTESSKLTLLATLHYLWDQAGFTRWSPAMENKRHWGVVRKYLLEAAADKATKSEPLSDILFIPESFQAERKEAIAQARRVFMSRFAAQNKSARKLMLMIGEVKDMGAARYGYKITLKHLPDCALFLDEKSFNRFTKRYALELGLWTSVENSHLMAIATVSVDAAGVCHLEEIALMPVTERWIPFENADERALLDKLSTSGRRFTKGLRYNLGTHKPLAVAVLQDTAPKPTALYISHGVPDYQTELQELIRDSELASWIWDPNTQALDALPA